MSIRISGPEGKAWHRLRNREANRCHTSLTDPTQIWIFKFVVGPFHWPVVSVFSDQHCCYVCVPYRTPSLDSINYFQKYINCASVLLLNGLRDLYSLFLNKKWTCILRIIQLTIILRWNATVFICFTNFLVS